MNRVLVLALTAVALVLWLTGIAVLAAALQQPPQIPVKCPSCSLVKIIPASASGLQPSAVVVLWDAPEETQLCAEVQAGPTPCRSAKEFREWVKSHPR
jgi:hypothetical protein